MTLCILKIFNISIYNRPIALKFDAEVKYKKCQGLENCILDDTFCNPQIF